MRVLFVSAEVAPFAKVGGLADVALALPRALAELGVEVAVVMPEYRGVREKTELVETVRFSVPVGKGDKECVAMQGALPESEVPIYFLRNDLYFDRPQIYGDAGGDYPDSLERFAFLSRGALALCEALDWPPDIIHLNDWHTALIPVYLRTNASGLGNVGSVLTIHNLAYQGVFPWEEVSVTRLSEDALRGVERQGKVNLLKGGILHADLLTTVSPSYASEILEHGEGLEDALQSRKDALTGVLNGVDASVWDPAHDPHLWARYSPDDLAGKEENKRRIQTDLGLEADPRAPLVGVISRLAEQKGFDLVMAAFERMMALGIQFVLLGTGEPRYESFFREVASRYKGRAASLITFSEEWAHRIEAASDIFLMPSRFEPCRLNQMYSLRYGTVPVVRATGGLRDTVTECDPKSDVGNGFVFTEYSPEAMLAALRRAIELYRNDPQGWRRLQVRGMREDHSWQASAREYLALYERLIADVPRGCDRVARV
jgi:starch synthase